MKIAVIGPTYPYKGGISHYNSLLCNALAKRHDVFLISFKRQYPKLLFPGKDQKDFSSNIRANVPQKRILDSINPFSWLEVVAKVKNDKPDLLIMYWWTPFWTLPFSIISKLVRTLTKTKVLFLCHNVIPHEKTKIDNFLTKRTLKNGSFFITHSKKDLEELIKLLPGANGKIGFHPTYDVFNMGALSKKYAQRMVGVNGNILLFFGYVRKYKGLIHLINAMPLILKKIDVKLLIVGEFWNDKDDYVEKIKSLGIEDKVVIVDKYVPDNEIGKYFFSSLILVLPY